MLTSQGSCPMSRETSSTLRSRVHNVTCRQSYQIHNCILEVCDMGWTSCGVSGTYENIRRNLTLYSEMRILGSAATKACSALA
jgi:hypothetical protein